MGESAVDSTFEQALVHRPKPTRREDEGIPLIDLSVLNSPHTDADLARLFSETGNVINHGVPLEYREKIELGSRKFFALPKEEKLKVRRSGVGLLGCFTATNYLHGRDMNHFKESNLMCALTYTKQTLMLKIICIFIQYWRMIILLIFLLSLIREIIVTYIIILAQNQQYLLSLS
ncbi:unnamed protein product [Coffea canephora]|uniref:DH200=94 genomic scaffold, scaffold_299 n=1 Tax=Coffea canephora TaxID=49390 RepID=A0A068VDR0_COFCA|nr:unnamed protein product [Coffea canephora]